MKPNKTPTAVPPVPAIAPVVRALPFVPCNLCRFMWRGTCRLYPPTMTAGWAVYPPVTNADDHGCWQGKEK